MYSLLVGEIGIGRGEFLRRMRWWELRAVIDGYRKRERTLWTVARWQTFLLMHNGMVDLGKMGIHREYDLARFPWEKEGDVAAVSDAEVERLQRMMREENARLEKEQQKAPAP